MCIAQAAAITQGSEAQKSAHLGAFTGETFHPGALACLEPGYGADPHEPRSRARRNGAGWLIDGHKCLTTWLPGGDTLLLSASTDEGPGLFLLPRDAEGLHVVPEQNLGIHALPTVELEVRGVQVGDDALLPVAGGATLRALLADTPLHLEANQLLATYLLDRGQPEPALRHLVAAQSVNSRQPQTLSLLSRAYAASGDAVMARQLQSEAFDASGRAPDAALRYALLLADAGSESAAIDVLNASLSRFPEDLGLLTTLGEQYRLTAQWERAASIEDRLRQIGTGEALLVAERIRFDRQVAQEDIEVAIGYLDQRWSEGRDSAASYAAITRANLSSGHPDRARRVLELGLSRFPEDRNLRAAGATLALAEQKFDEAAAILQDLLQDMPNNEPLWIDLLRVRQRQDDLVAAADVIDAGLAANPGAALLRWELALNREARGDHDGAIEVYEALLADHPSSAPVRNNLATLLSTAREDGGSLARAAEIAAPLAGSPVPHFLDTYGWIEFRRNAFGPAAEALTAAALQLRDNPKVQFHAAEALAATDRGDEARQHYEAVIRLAVNDNDPLAARARAALDAMPADGTKAAN